MQDVDVEEILEGMKARKKQELDWRHSIVDLMKLLDLDSSLAARKELATELGCPANLMGDSARARDTPIVLVLYPDLLPGEWTAESYPARGIHEQVAAEARAAGLSVLDLAAAFAGQGGDWKRWWATPYDAHPSAAAHAVAAEAIARYIRERDLLSGAHSGTITAKSTE